MSRSDSSVTARFPKLLREIKARIQRTQTRAVLSVNSELVRLYWDIGQMIDRRQREEGWGAGVIPRIARELHNELPEEKGFSERNIARMIAFFRAYPRPDDFLPQAVAKLPPPKVPQPVAKMEPPDTSILWFIPWGHHALLLEKIHDLADRLWYLAETLTNGWSRNVLRLTHASVARKPAIVPPNHRADRSRTCKSSWECTKGQNQFGGRFEVTEKKTP